MYPVAGTCGIRSGYKIATIAHKRNSNFQTLTASSSSNGCGRTRQSNRPSVVSIRVFPHTTRALTPTTSFNDGFIPEPKGRDVVLPTLDVFIQVLTIAKDACGVPPAQVAFSAASSLLTMIRACFSLLYEDTPYVCLGHNGQ
jgi:hypothetical protein